RRPARERDRAVPARRPGFADHGQGRQRRGGPLRLDANARLMGVERSGGVGEATALRPPPARVWVERLQLTDFRNYASLTLEAGPRAVVVAGANGGGKTNLPGALSLLARGQGLRRSPYGELARSGTPGWAVAARLNLPEGAIDVGTAYRAEGEASRPGRVV